MPAFVVEDGTGVTDATTYVSLIEANDYLSVKGNFDEWDALDDAVKEARLMWATRLLDQRATYNGHKYGEGPLRWPRTGVKDCDNIAISYDSIPGALKDATIEVAYHLAVNDIDPSAPFSNAGEISRIKADVLEIEYTEKTSFSGYFPAGLSAILRCIGTIKTGNGSNHVRIIRA